MAIKCFRQSRPAPITDGSDLIPYWTLFFAAVVGAITSGGSVNERRNATPLFIVFGFFTALFIGLRYEVGADWNTYLDIYNYVSHVPLSRAVSDGDIAYQTLNWMAAHRHFDFWAVNLFCAAFFTWGLLRFCSVQPNPWIAIAIAIPYIVIVVAMGYTRQATALGFVMAGLGDYIRRENLLRFAAYVLLGALFHSTAVVAFILIGLTDRKSRFVNFFLVLALSFFFYRTFITHSMDRLDRMYLQSGSESQGALIRVLLNVVAGLAFFIFRKRLEFSETEKKIWRNFSFASFLALFALTLVSSSTAVDRAAIYLMPLQIAVFSRVAITSGISSILAVLGGFAIVQFSWLTFADHSKYWVPYQAYPFK